MNRDARAGFAPNGPVFRGGDVAASDVPGAVPWPPGVLARASGAAGRITAPLWLWSCTYVGARPRTLGRPRVLNRGQIEIRDDVVIDSRFSRTELITSRGGRIVIGAGTFIRHGTMLVASRLVELGDRVALGAYCIVADTDGVDAREETSGDDATPIWIGDEVVLGPRVTVLPGAVVGAGSHILPGSMVAGEIPPGVVAGGNPARPIRRLQPAGAAPAMPAPRWFDFPLDARTGATR